MRENENGGAAAPPRDIRLLGFSTRTSVEQATRWIDGQAALLPEEEIETACASGRVLAAGIVAPWDVPDGDRAIEDGYAVRGRETVGAGDYNPQLLKLQSADTPLVSGTSALVESGTALPGGADAILPFGAAHSSGATLEVFSAVAEGAGVERAGQQARAGTYLIERGRTLTPQGVGLLASLGLDRVHVVRQPRVRLIIAGPKPSPRAAVYDALNPMLRALVGRDGGIVSAVASDTASRAAMIDALTSCPGDVILVAGRTGMGADDEASLALAAAGELALHGIALRPGGSAGMGLIGAVPVVLLPGDPVACMCVYELFAGRLIRRLGGRNPDFPHPVCHAVVRRKIISAIGLVDICHLRFVRGGVEPVSPVEPCGFASALRADGFVVIASPLEGYAPGAPVAVRVYPGTAAARIGLSG